MKVNLTLEFDAKRWAEEYGLEPADVREDFVNWLMSTLYSAEVPILVRR
jgi:hypothetical protein